MSVKPLAFIPEHGVLVPERLLALAQGDSIRPVWVNGVGGVTFRMGEGTGRERYVKYAAAGTPESDFAREAARMEWAGRFSPVPEVLEQGADEQGSWLATRAMAGASAVDPVWVARPEQAARAIGAGLRALHDALPVEGCRFSWSVVDRLEGFEARIASGGSPADWGNGYSRFTVEQARKMLCTPPPIDKLVVCHGDACAPNTLLDRDGNFAGHVDLGAIGVADRWADLAVAAWSTEWNYGLGYERLVYEAYGIQPDAERIAYYRMLWDLT
ncbi:aminoglycoside 3'-phosphotransferase [Paeniglutamicibacter kerguelensis]|uniref:Kanamycin kinase n=1 Tax=Paeniglutamicibacter kerguelensis TaxID=254788 RepID=A0ABS4XGL4_9MICC|nr:aminoglycoside 3'-phosphotransferase [Paeniglutamicibacter kerguelensis]MBP2387481.1 kanamycin kinase [Paeniglutamicibacter kerguelensis]